MTNCLPIMVQGTHSDAGKSLLVTALCRIFANKGLRTAPFKSQNMALNSYITIDGKEIGRAQGVQAEAARIQATTYMNPILIKPEGENRSQIVVHGKPLRTMQAGEYREDFYEYGKQLIQESFSKLATDYERIVIEGAGSPAEINLNERELVNMSVAAMAKAPVILVGDIDKGGVFASLVGTLQLLDPDDRQRIIGVVINKFRGDLALLQPGLDWFEDYTSLPVLGVIPFIEDLTIDAEDSLALANYESGPNLAKALDIAVLHYPRIANFTDIDPLVLEHDCHVRFVKKRSELGTPDMIVLPGSKNTLEDLQYLRDNGITEAVIELVEKEGTRIVGICGGYQMLGTSVMDPSHIESAHRRMEGFNLIKHMTTTLTAHKRTVLVSGQVQLSGHILPVDGYEIHMGRTNRDSNSYGSHFIHLSDGEKDGFISEDERIIGTYLHGIFANDEFRHTLLNKLCEKKGVPVTYDRCLYQSVREKSLSTLADVVESHLNMALIEQKMDAFSKQ
ncbi:cobyric acid synthase [Salipaludibacillus agaradhaerens]|uniref:cobyric acid synthase n=1 Tax=Salipaludibacillus agaradhaerens TaxID=76935 RepID=UPI000997167E|nr:cobyric acid synthase [Salipaludibacillus agaradhaerens]